jgi:hypothetical protein
MALALGILRKDFHGFPRVAIAPTPGLSPWLLVAGKFPEFVRAKRTDCN